MLLDFFFVFWLFFFLHWHFLKKKTHLCTVECTYTLKLSYKNLLYCTLLLYVLLAKGIFHNDHSLCFYMFFLFCFFNDSVLKTKEADFARLC